MRGFSFMGWLFVVNTHDIRIVARIVVLPNE